MTATFTLDYIDQAAAEEAARRKQADDVLRSAVGKTAKEVIGALETLGRDYIVMDPNGDIISYVTDPTYAGARSRAKVTEVEGAEISGRKVRVTLDRLLTITREDSAEFAEMLDVRSEFDERIGRFVQGHIGGKIEFDGHVAYVMPHPDKNTRFDILLIAGDADNVDGPQFKFEDINLTYDMRWSGPGPDYVTENLGIHIVARIDKWTGDSALVLLTPVQTSLR